MTYRPDIDGLRALAVLPVLFFHLGIPGFSGGYVGVDLFFVISGFLITRILVGEIDAGTFRFAVFYERRIRRLFPAAPAVFLATSIVAALLLLPGELVKFGGSLAATQVFAANVWFWRNSGYFDPAAEQSPLLHMWSLAVEEQFYLVFPPVLLLAARFLPSRRRTLLILLCALSLALGVAALATRPVAAFYLPVFRAWELLLGSLLAAGGVPAFRLRPLREGTAWTGLALVAVAVFAFTPETPFPGLYALVPCVGAFLLLHAAGSGEVSTGRMLGWEPLAWIGRISYSLYLWHWPLIVFYRHQVGREIGDMERLVLLVASFLVATISWRYVETPFRTRARMPSRRMLFTSAALVTLLFLGVAAAIQIGRGFPGRFDARTVALDRERNPEIPFLGCFERTADHVLDGSLCRVGWRDPEGAVDVLVWGDSHSLALLPAIDSALSRNGRSGVYAGTSACPPLFGVENRDRRHRNWRCREFSEAIRTMLGRPGAPREVLLAAAWTSYANDEGNYVLEHVDGASGNANVFPRALEETVRALRGAGKSVWIVTNVPDAGVNVPEAMLRDWRAGRPAAEFTGRDRHEERSRAFRQGLAFPGGMDSVRFIDLDPVYCGAEGCRIAQDGDPLYRDAGHLNARGARLAVPAFTEAFGRAR